jgi:hypothetical protein
MNHRHVVFPRAAAAVRGEDVFGCYLAIEVGA